jgi:hypothetical protein
MYLQTIFSLANKAAALSLLSAGLMVQYVESAEAESPSPEWISQKYNQIKEGMPWVEVRAALGLPGDFRTAQGKKNADWRQIDVDRNLGYAFYQKWRWDSGTIMILLSGGDDEPVVRKVLLLTSPGSVNGEQSSGPIIADDRRVSILSVVLRILVGFIFLIVVGTLLAAIVRLARTPLRPTPKK